MNGKHYFEHGGEAIKMANKKENREKGVKVIQGNGDHVKIQYKNEEIVTCNREIGRGLGCVIWKWFKLRNLLIASFLFVVINPHMINNLIKGFIH
jgi:hypothetical protein